MDYQGFLARQPRARCSHHVLTPGVDGKRPIAIDSVFRLANTPRSWKQCVLQTVIDTTIRCNDTGMRKEFTRRYQSRKYVYRASIESRISSAYFVKNVTHVDYPSAPYNEPRESSNWLISA